MNRFCWLMLVALIPACTMAQNKPADSPELPRGSLLRVMFLKSPEAANAKVGDTVRASVLGLVAGGKLKRPRQPLTLVGHITEVQPRTKGQTSSRMGVAFDKIVIGALDGENREIPVGAIITAVVTEERSMVGRTTVPTSGDDPMQRAAGPMVDKYGQPVYPTPPPLERAGPSGMKGIRDQRVKDFTLVADESTNVTVIVCKKRDIVLGPDMRMMVRVNSSGK